MTFGEYQELARRTSNYKNVVATLAPHFVKVDAALSMAALGLAGESGEVVDYLKKVIHHGHDLDRVKLAKELGDVLWYVAEVSSTAGISLDEVASMNIEKLKSRYPDGFSSERSQNRAANDE